MSIKISIINESTVLKDSDIDAVIPSLQQQITRDFGPIWGVYADLFFKSQEFKSWQLVVLDDSDQAGALGYHEVTYDCLPLGKVFAGTDLKYGNSWTTTMSHEILEMLADPEINLCATVDNLIYAYEVCDPCESDALGYEIDGVLLSDFVYPAWFCPSFSGPYDFKGHISSPLELAKGGYISIMDSYGSWKQITEEKGLARREPVGSRRERRRIPISERLRSTK